MYRGRRKRNAKAELPSCNRSRHRVSARAGNDILRCSLFLLWQPAIDFMKNGRRGADAYAVLKGDVTERSEPC